jgi:hypothetical protein
MKMSMLVFWIVMPCGLARASPRGATTQKTIVKSKVKQSLYTPWRRLGEEEV